MILALIGGIALLCMCVDAIKWAIVGDYKRFWIIMAILEFGFGMVITVDSLAKMIGG